MKPQVTKWPMDGFIVSRLPDDAEPRLEPRTLKLLCSQTGRHSDWIEPGRPETLTWRPRRGSSDAQGAVAGEWQNRTHDRQVPFGNRRLPGPRGRRRSAFARTAE